MSVPLFPVHTALLCGDHSDGSSGCALDVILQLGVSSELVTCAHCRLTRLRDIESFLCSLRWIESYSHRHSMVALQLS